MNLAASPHVPVEAFVKVSCCDPTWRSRNTASGSQLAAIICPFMHHMTVPFDHKPPWSTHLLKCCRNPVHSPTSNSISYHTTSHLSFADS
ncbi:hypothetical protein A0H81_06692 [Grifola frondosa]|uniref:Uncharacterized protein n=1 Tax=Grifola frondosa TaxID=5627 RepID=A0A1C7M8H7_GRIFR|nr:hypothetical protein A0H81_06692 [Grifola frondosa]